MRISDWSSDVCSSDLRRQETLPQGFLVGFADRGQWNAVDDLDAFRRLHRPFALTEIGGQVADILEDHTSALQSLMRISYAVLCLKNQKYHSRCNRGHRYRSLPVYVSLIVTGYLTNVRYNFHYI